MSVQIPKLLCAVTIETYCRRDNSLSNRCVISEAMVTLGRNALKDCVIRVDDRKSGRSVHQFVLMHTKLNYKLNTRFVLDGKSSITLTDPNVCIFISNCPSNQLSLFLKCFVFKCDYYKRSTGEWSGVQDMRQRLVADKHTMFDEMSPLSAKDIDRNVAIKRRLNAQNMALNALNGNGVQESPKSSKCLHKKSLKKRKLIERDENCEQSVRKRQTMEALIPSPVRQMRLLNENRLTGEQRRVMSAVVSGRSVFFTGSAGTGKSYLLRFIIARLPPDTTYVTASTGIAASHIGGMTLHMFTGLTPDQSRDASAEECALKLMSNACKVNKWRKCKCLIIDEISMVCGKYFQLVDSVAKIVRNCDQPFGGIQLVVCGDFLQLPPITRRDEEKVFAFQSTSWDQCIGHSFQLSHVKRQSDHTFIRLLQNIRIGNCDHLMTTQILDTLNNDLKCKDLCPTRLYTHRNDVDLINSRQLSAIDSKCVVFTAEDIIKPENWVIRVSNQKYVMRRHLPLQLSWALSIHKSQGMTIDNGVEISLARVFECGQTYVALSRCKTLSNLRIIDFNPKSVIVDSNALQFYNNLKFN
ncbi:unnamed protein product [Oppiella nova]|uniref:ATP-dependent DNA helicase n=1 Tax=Oppiella nova TaxID=334625 RepID=A0A7R9M5R9_9ACAR|nr:unnamed protein product [Oppiella nova]CAG2170118.1 unnamed protein product [Oppiella nova]